MTNIKENNIWQKLSLNTIYNMDCIEGMKLIPDWSIDLTVTSPPYDNLRTYNWYSWDFEGVAKELLRVTKVGGVVVWVVNDSTVNGSETLTSFKQAIYFKEIGFNVHDTMIYNKDVPPLNSKRYQPSFEYMFILSRKAPKTFNPILTECSYSDNRKSKKYHREKDGVFVVGERIRKTRIIPQGMKIKDNIWHFLVGGGKSSMDKISFNHPATFPEKLAEDHILSWSNEWDIVFDPFMWSWTTAKMAKINNRNFIWFEISQEYVDIANKRIQDSLSEK